MEVVKDYLYTKEHEWIDIEGTTATIGITEYAQSALGDVTFVELPKIDTEVEQFEQLASVESVKAASDIFSPMSGKVIEVNKALESDPPLLNKSCYEEGWIAKIAISDIEEKSNLMTAAEYRKFLEGLEE
ncbi:MAG TPA: glycine cleavage system protein GcvH [Candidatus Omnitrophota bacterium]|nr:glycine cleavage system protein GcvH [Candidatus Omnitrophota bacterium]HPD85113.1 glycine cleavage system protein GcvH [Candidatus Omnitrophota bacterium]HRZ03971.1 glycine cleavage system protein GcvH [Candidatus Omnitrophota bacterium]